MFRMLEPNVTKLGNAAKLGGAVEGTWRVEMLHREIWIGWNAGQSRILCFGQGHLSYMEKLEDGRQEAALQEDI